jgi:RNA binding exosome subunit
MSKRTESITQPDVDTSVKRHSTESPERVKEIIDKLIMNRGEHPSKDKPQHQILTLRRAKKTIIRELEERS